MEFPVGEQNELSRSVVVNVARGTGVGFFLQFLVTFRSVDRMGMTCTVFGDGAVFRGEEGESENDTLGPAPGNNIPLGIQAVVNVSVTLANANTDAPKQSNETH